MTYLFCLLIYLLTVALIGCQPIDTCYDDVSDVLNAAAKGWMRMSEVRPDNDVNAIMAAGVQRLNDNKNDEKIYQLDRDENGHVAGLEMFQQVSDGINYCVRYGVKVVGGKDGDDRNFMPADEERPERLCDSLARRSVKDAKPKLAWVDGVKCD